MSQGRRQGRARGCGAATLVALVALVLCAPAVASAGGAADIERAVACACFKAGELVIDKGRSISKADCPCPYAEQVRRDLASAVAQSRKAGDRVALALAVEQHFLTASPEYERLLRYDQERYTWFLQNVRCTCPGCKATVYFSNCQLTCSPAIVYKKRARVWLALGFTTDQLIDYYLAEYNATHSAREQISRAWLLPKRERRRGWMVPAMLIGGAILVLAFLLGRVARRSRGAGRASPDSPRTPGPPADAPDRAPGPPAAGEVSEAERDRLLDALDDLDRDGGW